MSLYRQLKNVFLLPFSKHIQTVLVGTADQWSIPEDWLNPRSFVISAGVGTAITFELGLMSKFGSSIVLMDPSPTGVQTMAAHVPNKLISFSPRGLAARSGQIEFGLPDRPEEGSFKKGGGSSGLTFPCTSLVDLLAEHKKEKIDLLKIDVEGFEYEIIESIIEKRICVDVICVEIHHDKVIDISETIVDAAKLIIRLCLNGYVVVYNKNMDFTFVHRRLLKQLAAERSHRKHRPEPGYRGQSEASEAALERGHASTVRTVATASREDHERK